MTHFKINHEHREAFFGLMLLITIMSLCYYGVSLKLKYIASVPEQSGYEVVLSRFNPESFGIEAVFMYDYKEYDENCPWYADKSPGKECYNPRLIIFNERTDSTAVNIELIERAKTTIFETLKFKESLLVARRSPEADSCIVKIYSLSGELLGSVDVDSLWIDDANK